MPNFLMICLILDSNPTLLYVLIALCAYFNQVTFHVKVFVQFICFLNQNISSLRIMILKV